MVAVSKRSGAFFDFRPAIGSSSSLANCLKFFKSGLSALRRRSRNRVRTFADVEILDAAMTRQDEQAVEANFQMGVLSRQHADATAGALLGMRRESHAHIFQFFRADDGIDDLDDRDAILDRFLRIRGDGDFDVLGLDAHNAPDKHDFGRAELNGNRRWGNKGHVCLGGRNPNCQLALAKVNAANQRRMQDSFEMWEVTLVDGAGEGKRLNNFH